MMKLLLAFAALSLSLVAQSSTPIHYPEDLFNNKLTMEAQAVPTTPTVITTRSLIFGGGWISCTGTQTITLTDGNSIAMIPTAPWAGPQVQSLNMFAGSYISGGFSISASATGCKYHAWWKQ